MSEVPLHGGCRRVAAASARKSTMSTFGQAFLQDKVSAEKRGDARDLYCFIKHHTAAMPSSPQRLQGYLESCPTGVPHLQETAPP